MKRREFLRSAGFLAAGAALGACTSKSNESGQTGKTPGPMTLRTNPNTGDKVSVLGYGCMRLPQTGEGKDAPLDHEEIARHVDYALEHGVNYFDTSPAYCRGQSEDAIGRALSRHPRESYFIATKLSNFAPEQQSAEASQKMFLDSLKHLRTDYIDYYLLHVMGRDGMDGANARFFDNGMVDFLMEQKKAGKIRNLGFSYHGDVNTFDEMLRRHDAGLLHWDFIQIQLNYYNWEHPAEEGGPTAKYLYDELAKRDIPVVIMEPLLGGTLAKLPQPIVTKLKGRRPQDSAASWAFRFAAQPAVLTVLSGMTYMDNIRENVATFSPHEPVTEDEHALLMRVATELSENDSVPCTGCAYCMPCPYGVDIPGVFAHYNRCVAEDLVRHDTRDPDFDTARRAYLRGLGLAVSPLRQADMCVGCGACRSHCPQTIDIPAQLARIDRYTESLRTAESS